MMSSAACTDQDYSVRSADAFTFASGPQLPSHETVIDGAANNRRTRDRVNGPRHHVAEKAAAGQVCRYEFY